jgi:hypothetical protein
MKIGILTLPFNNNYGGLLQSYALQTYIRERGHEVVIINREVVEKKTLKQKIKKYIKQVTGIEYNQSKKSIKKTRLLNKLISEQMLLSEKILKYSDYKLVEKLNLDIIIVGSDQVWRFDYTEDRFKEYFLNFISRAKIKKLSYAASFGVDNWVLDSKETCEIKELIKEFDGVSVRETNGYNLCIEHLNYDNVEVNIDPVLLFPQNIYTRNFDITESEIKTTTAYLLDPTEDKLTLVSKVANRTKYQIKYTGKYNRQTLRNQYPSIDEWLSDFLNANFIVTDSFHGCVLSIVFNKNFVVYGNKKRGLSRFNSILKKFNLEDRIVYSSDDIPKIIYSPINYKEVNNILNKERLKSDKYFSRFGI